MNMQKDELQKLWNENNAPAECLPDRAAAAPNAAARGRTEAGRLRRSLGRDGWLKLCAVVLLGAALPIFAGRFNAAVWGVFFFTALAVLLGVFQVIWSRQWSEANPALPLAQALAAELKLWRRRRLLLAALLGATPALAWQIYQLAYLAMNPARSGRLVNILFLTAGGPLLWLLASWRQWARLEAWLLQIEGALATFDEETAARYQRASQRATRRTAIIITLLLFLLLAGVVFFWLAR